MQNVNAATPNPPMGMEPFGEWFNEVFRLWSAQWQVWVLQGLIFFAIVIVPALIVVIAVILSLPHHGASSYTNSMATRIGAQAIIRTVAIICGFISCLLLPGMVNTALKQIRGQPISAGDIFSRMHNVWGTWLVRLLIGLGILACCVGFFAMQGLLLLAVPLMVDQRMTTSQAISVSWNTTKSNFWLYVLFGLVIGLISAVGIIVCYIGLIATIPLLPIGQAVAYAHTFPTGMMVPPERDPAALSTWTGIGAGNGTENGNGAGTGSGTLIVLDHEGSTTFAQAHQLSYAARRRHAALKGLNSSAKGRTLARRSFSEGGMRPWEGRPPEISRADTTCPT